MIEVYFPINYEIFHIFFKKSITENTNTNLSLSQSTEYRVQSTEYRAQSTEYKCCTYQSSEISHLMPNEFLVLWYFSFLRSHFFFISYLCPNQTIQPHLFDVKQAQMAELFQKDRTVIGRHIRNVYKEGELEEEGTCAKFAHMGNDGLQRYETVCYNPRHHLRCLSCEESARDSS